MPTSKNYKITKLAVISGKGGTGKTFISASFAALAKNHVIADCDVDAANLHLLLRPEQKAGPDSTQIAHSFFSGNQYEIRPEICTRCGKCQNICRYEAIAADYHIDPIACEGCGACYFVCPAKAIWVTPKQTGQYYIADTAYAPFIHARLQIGEDNSGKLVAQVRQTTDQVTKQADRSLQVIDGPPGLGCPVNATLTGLDLAVIVTEPTMSGIHDLKRIIKLTEYFGLPAKVLINKWDINRENSKSIERYCQQKDIPVIGKIPYSIQIIKALVNKEIFINKYPKHQISRIIRTIWSKIND